MAMFTPVKSAPCPLLAAENGIRSIGEDIEHYPTANGTHYTNRKYAQAYCDLASECGSCPLFREYAVEKQNETGKKVRWVCFRCYTKVPAESTYLEYLDAGPCSFCGKEAIILNAVLTD